MRKKMHKAIILPLFAILSFEVSASAYMRQHTVACLPTKTMFEYLETEYKEQIVMGGNNEKNIVTVWLNTKSGTSSVVITNFETGESCLVTSMTGSKMVDNDKKS